VSAPVFDDRGRVTMVLCSLAFSSELNESTVADAGELIRARTAPHRAHRRHQPHPLSQLEHPVRPALADLLEPSEKCSVARPTP